MKYLRSITLIIVAVLAGCKPIASSSTQFVFFDPRENSGVGVEFRELVDEFKALSGLRFKIAVDFGYKRGMFPIKPWDKDTTGACVTYSTGHKEVLIRAEKWYTRSALERRKTIFHELGHCILGRPHNDELMMWKSQTFVGQVPRSIMYSRVINERILLELKSYYDAELFGYQ